MLTLWVTICISCARLDSEPLPTPTGIHKTGRVSFHWKDESRDELETSAPGDKRELMVHLFYPVDATATGARAPYVPDADVMRGPWSDEQVARVQSMRSYSIESAAPLGGDSRFPVVVFAPGGGMKGLTYQTLCEDLASHGWAVAVIDPPYNARGVRFPDGRVLGNLAPAERGWPVPRSGEDERRSYEERVVHWSRDVSFVIDQLTLLDRGNGPFAKRLDLERGVGVFGHSRGGQAAGAARLLDERVRCGVNLDGMTGDRAILPVRGDDSSGTQPFLWIHKPLPPPPTEAQLERAKRTRADYDAEVERMLASWQRQLESVTGGAIRVVVERPGVEHIDFSDEPFWDGLTTPDKRPGKLRTIAETREWLRAFFDATLRGNPEGLKALARHGRDLRAQEKVDVFGGRWR
jgi:dienelactone hydrolase